jgi:hypothetical protein
MGMQIEREPSVRCRIFTGDSQRTVLEVMMRWEQREGHFIDTMSIVPPHSDIEGDETYVLTVYYCDKNA